MRRNSFFKQKTPPPSRQARTAFLIYIYISIIICHILKNNFQSPMDFVFLTTGGFFVHQIYYQGFPDLLGQIEEDAFVVGHDLGK